MTFRSFERGGRGGGAAHAQEDQLLYSVPSEAFFTSNTVAAACLRECGSQQVQEQLYAPSPSLSSTLAHNTGRSSFPRCVTVALRLGWKVEMYAWRASMSICYPAFAALSRGRMTIQYLDEWRADVRPQHLFVHDAPSLLPYRVLSGSSGVSPRPGLSLCLQ